MAAQALTVSVATGQQPHERTFLDSFAKAAKSADHRVVRDGEADLYVVWGAEPPGPGPTIHVECGWLPRWHYQVSHGGINADHHRARPQLDVTHGFVSSEWRAFAARYVRSIRERLKTPPPSFPYLVPSCNCSLPAEYILCPLQDNADANMRHVPFGQEEFVHRVLRWAPLPVVFKQHPARRAVHDSYDVPPPHRWVTHREASIYGLLSRPECRAVVTLNSNTAHDALLWNVPAIVLGRGVWPETLWPAQLISLRRVLRWHAEHEERRWAYVAWLAVMQWRLIDAQTPEYVQTAIEEALDADR